MWEKETNYKLSLKKNLIYEFCHETYKESESFDVVFITKEKCKLHAHQVILALSSDLIKSFDVPSNDCVIKLPDYSMDVVSSFIEFIYTGETLMDIENQEEFLSLCKDMMVEIPGLSPDNFQVVQDEVVEHEVEYLVNEMEEVNESQDEKFMKIKTVELREPDELIEELDMKLEESRTEIEVKNSELLPDETEQGNTSKKVSTPRLTMKTNVRIKAMPPRSTPGSSSTLTSKESTQEENLQKAIDAVNNGLNTRRASLMFGVPKTTLYRKLSQVKKKI